MASARTTGTWNRVGPSGLGGGGAEQFPSMAEAAKGPWSQTPGWDLTRSGKELKAKAAAATAQARLEAEAAREAQKQSLLQDLDSFRGAARDPNAAHWDEVRCSSCDVH